MSASHLPSYYCERYVLFLDILGFKEIVKEIEDDEANGAGKLNIIKRLLQEIKLEGQISNDTSKMAADEARYTLFSDCLVVSTKAHDGGLKSMLARASGLPMRWMKKGIFFRGAIAKGLLWHDEIHLIGSGLNRAYEMESRLARYPRVLVDDEVIEDTQNLDGTLKSWVENTCLRDVDGLYCLTPFDPYQASGRDAQGVHFAEDHLQAVHQHIQNAYDQAEDREIKAKYYWLGRQFNEVQDEWHKKQMITRVHKVSL